MDIYTQLQSRLNGYRAKFKMVSVDHIGDLESEYLQLFKNSLVDKQLYEKYIKGYIDFSIKEKHPSVRSLIITATPSPQVELKFKMKGKDTWFKIPPVYTDRLLVTRRIKEITSQVFDNNGYKTFSVVLPKKLIAVHSGLAEYGKNNLVYVKGMGSYNRLTLYATDLPCKNDSWQSLKQLKRCKKCYTCQNNCPTSAIGKDNFIVKAERCLAYYNERAGQFPDWIDSMAHNCLIGCIKCQDVCPENSKYTSPLRHKEEFNEEETNMILNNISFEELPINLQAKISSLCLKYYYKHLSRNILPLIQNKNEQ